MLALSALSTASVAQNVLPPVEVTPSVVGVDGVVALRLPANWPLSTNRYRVGIYEHGRPALLGDAVKEFAVRDGRLQTTLRLQAEAGVYDIRLVSNDRARNFLTAPAVALVPGVDREPGWWLFNGTPFSAVTQEPQAEGEASTPAAATPLLAGAPLFVAGLKRDVGRNAKPATGSTLLPGGQSATWNTVRLPSLRTIGQAEYDFLALTRGKNGLIGVIVPLNEAGSTPAPDDTIAGIIEKVRSLRNQINSVAPDAALILEVDGNTPHSLPAVRSMDAVAPLFDAVVIRGEFPDSNFWPVKVARRIAEEQPHYDLPIFIEADFSNDLIPRKQAGADLLEAFMSGATGIINGQRATADWGRVVQRNLPLFVGSVTLEDIGILPSTPDAATLRFYEQLRAANRIPLLARLNNRPARRGAAESFVVSLDERIDLLLLNDLLTTARSGARLYIEGAPLTDTSGRPLDSRIVTLLGGKTTPVNVRRLPMKLEDPWLFGTARGSTLDVEQRVATDLREATDEERKPQKGEAPLGLSVAARLPDGSPGIVINPVGDGEVIWMPHRVVDTPAAANYYAAIAGRMQPALAQLENVEPKDFNRELLSTALRQSAGGTLLLALFNRGDKKVTAQATVRANAGVAFDLATEKTLPLQTRGFESQATVSIEPHGWALVAFAKSREELEKERNAPRLKARLQ